MSEIENIFYNLNFNNKIGHAYLLYDLLLEDIEQDLYKVLENYFFKGNNLSIKNNPDIHIIDGDSSISKEQIKILQHQIATSSQINNNIVYIINHCDRMTASASNSLLKMLEEPEKNIFAFLITDHVSNILPTIKSRCVNIFLCNKKINFEEEIVDLSIELINDLNNNNGIYIYEKLRNKTRNDIKNIILVMCYLYKDLLNQKNNRKLEFFDKERLNEIYSLIDGNQIIKKILYLNKNGEKLNYNVNINMFLDSFIINWR